MSPPPLDDIVERFGERHRDLDAMFDRHATRLAEPAPGRRRAVRAAPAAARRRRSPRSSPSRRPPCATRVRCRRQIRPASAPGELRAVLSVRQIGEGHRSSIGFRSFVVGADGAVTLDRRGPYATAGAIEDVELDVEVFRGLATDLHADVDPVGPRRTRPTLLRAAVDGAPAPARGATGHAPRRLGHVAAADRAGGPLLRGPVPGRVRSGRARAHPGVRRRVERSGGRPLRALRRRRRRPHLLRDVHRLRRVGDRPAAPHRRPTSSRFTSIPLLGAGAANKGLALFPRRIGGRYHALSRCDGERNALAVSDDLRHWPTATPLDVDRPDVELRPARQLRVTDRARRGVARADARRGRRCARTRSARSCSTSTTRRVVIGQTTRPLIAPRPDDQDGYVPNVVYSCGSLRHGDHLVVPLRHRRQPDRVRHALHPRRPRRPARRRGPHAIDDPGGHRPCLRRRCATRSTALAQRRCWRCLQMFAVDSPVPVREEFWLCDPCGATLLPSKHRPS